MSCGPPAGAVSVAVRSAIENCEDWYSRCENFKATESERQEVSPADEVNGITERWCIRVEGASFRSFSSDAGLWKKDLLVVKRNGIWEYEQHCLMWMISE